MSDFTQAFSLAGQVALVTGGGTGIGQAIARSMHAAGAKVVLAGRREEELSRAVAEMGPGASYIVHDITEWDKAAALAERVENEVGPLTCLVNNAGRHLKKPAVDTGPEEFQDVLNTNVVSAHALTNAVAPRMIERGAGNIIFIASMASLFGIPNVIAYSAAKSALVGMVRTLSTEFAPRGLRVNAIAPGWIETEMSRKALDGDPARKSKILGRTPVGTLGQPADIGWAAVYLAAPASAFVTGVVLPIDGGVSIGF